MSARAAENRAVIDSVENGAKPPMSAPLLLASVFAVAICGLVYELIAGTMSTYLLGSSVTQFSIVIGLFLSAMGLGSFLSRFVTTRLLRVFIAVEIAIGIVGGSSALVLFFTFAVLKTYLPFLVLVSLLVGALVGLEIPLLVRILRQTASLRTVVGNVLAIDYLGALAGSLLFPLVCIPWLGLVRTSFLFGLLNVAVAVVGLRLLRRQLGAAPLMWASAVCAAVLLAAGLVTAGKATTLMEDMLYDDEIVFAETTPYQRLVLTRWRGDLRLYIDGNIQFSSVDESRYHESLVHPAMGAVHRPRRVLILGGGDGLAAREVLKHTSVEQIDIVDLDPAMTRIFSEVPLLVELNRGSLTHPKVRVINADAQKYLEETSAQYDVVIIDLPDPNSESLGKLYARSFYRLVAKHLTGGGVLVTQATSPFYATEAFWCIANTVRAARLSSAGGALHVKPYHANVPSFGEWGFVLASFRPLNTDEIRLEVETRFLTEELIPRLFVFPKDVGDRETPINRLDNQILVKLYERGFRRFH